MINIVYPYCKRKSKWNELEYSIKSVRKYLKEEHKIWVIGENTPDPAIADIVFFFREDQKNYHTERNNGEILEFCCQVFKNEEFIWFNDDIYLLKDTTVNNIKSSNRKPLCDMKSYKTRGGTRWQHLLWKTNDKLVFEAGVHPVYNFSTHTPYLYESDKMSWLSQRLPIFEGKVLSEMCYFNWFNVYEKDICNKDIIEFMDEKAGFYNWKDVQTIEQIKKAMHGKRYLNHDDNGLTSQLKSTISELFKD